jgi:acyl carrier protein
MSGAPAESHKIRSTVREYVLSQFLPGEDPSFLTDSTPLITGGILDSIGSVKLVSYLEDQFGVSFDAHEVSIDHLDTIDLVVATLEEKLQR